MKMSGLALLLIALVPSAGAVDLLPSEVRFGEVEARLLVRSLGANVTIATEPGVIGAGVDPGSEPVSLAPTPLTLSALYVWRGIDGIVEIVLRREDPGRQIDIIVEDGRSAGLWLEWPAARRSIPFPSALLLLPLAGAWRRWHAA